MGPNFSFVNRFRLKHILQVRITGTPDPRVYKSFPLKTDFLYAQVPFRTGFTTPQFKQSVVSGLHLELLVSISRSILLQRVKHKKQTWLIKIQMTMVISHGLALKHTTFRLLQNSNFWDKVTDRLSVTDSRYAKHRYEATRAEK